MGRENQVRVDALTQVGKCLGADACPIQKAKANVDITVVDFNQIRKLARENGLETYEQDVMVTENLRQTVVEFNCNRGDANSCGSLRYDVVEGETTDFLRPDLMRVK